MTIVWWADFPTFPHAAFVETVELKTILDFVTGYGVIPLSNVAIED
jgi:hypothetical protein